MNNIAAIEQQLTSNIHDAAQTDPTTRHKHDVSNLLAHRGDLRGVYAFADVAEDAVRWSA